MKDEAERLRIRVDKAWSEREKCKEAMKHSRDKRILDKFQLLDNKYWILRDRLDYYEGELVKEDDEIAIRKYCEGLENRYSIFLKEERVRIGQIDYEGYHKSMITGDIGYYIEAKYQGHNYAYKALCLLSSYLYENGVEDFYISVFQDNEASLKIIEKYGATLVCRDGKLRLYRCETRLMEKKKK